MTVAELLAALRGIDPSRTVAVVNPYRGKGKCYCTPKVAAERQFALEGTLYYPLETLIVPDQAVVFLIEG